MKTGNRESNAACLIPWRGKVPKRALRTRRKPPAPATRFYVFHESRNTDFTAVRFALGAQGSHNQNPPPGPPPGQCFLASMAVHDTEYPTKMHKIPDPAEKSLLAGSLLSPMARRCSVGGGEPVSAHGQCFSTRLTTSAVRWKSHKNAQNPGSRGKMREARPSPQLPSPCAPLPLRRMPNEPML